MQQNRYQNKPTNHELPPEGTYKAVAVWFIEEGMQPGYNGGPDEDTAYLNFELLNTKKANGEPFLIGRFNTIKFGPKTNWSKVQKALLGRTPEVGEVIMPDDLLGRGCQLVVLHRKREDGAVVAKIESLIPLSHGEEVSKPLSDLILFDFEENSQEVFDRLPDFLKEAIRRGKPYPKVAPTPTPADVSDFNDDIPF